MDLPGGLHARANLSGRDARRMVAQFLIRDSRNLDMQIDAIKQRSADLGEIALNNAGRAAAFAGGIAIKAAGTRIAVLVTNIIWLLRALG